MKTAYMFLLLGAASAPALAQAPTGENGADDTIVVTASRVPLKPHEVGSAVSIITREDIARGQVTFAKDILQDIPGVQISSDRPGGATSVSIRGSDNDQILYLIDGIELGDPSATSTQYQTDHLTTRDIARIEVLRGNQSSLYGSDAIGGVVNIITRRATEEGVHVNAEGEYGSHDTVNGGASVLGKTGPLDFRVTATGYRHEGPSLADPATGPATEDDAYWRYGLSGRAGVAATDSLEFQLVGFWLDSRSDLDNTSSDSTDHVRKREYALAGQGSYKSPDGRFHADLTASRYVARRLYSGDFNLPDGDLYKGIKDNLALNANYDSGSFFSVAAGANYQKEKTDQGTLFSGDLGASISTKSVYGELALRPVENLTLTGAARIDDNSRFGEFDTYRATAAYVVANALGGGDVKFRASYGTGAKAPGLYQLFDPTYGNPDLGVETSKGGDFGVDLSFGNRFTAQLSYFFGKVRNEILFDGSLPPFGGYAQFGRTKKSGVEAAFTVRPTDWLTVEQSYTYLKATEDEDEDGVYLDMGRPKDSGTTSVTLTPVDRLSLTARARYRSRNAFSFGGVTKGYAVVDLLGSYGITDRVEVYGRIVNLFDKQYQMSFGTNTLGLSAYGGVRLDF